MTTRSSTNSATVAIYREAARIVDEGRQDFSEYSCCAIDYAKRGHCAGMHSEEALRYVAAMAPERTDQYPATPEDPATRLQLAFIDCGDERKNVRVLALCFMAAMVEAGDA